MSDGWDFARPPSRAVRARLTPLPEIVCMKIVSLGSTAVGKTCLIKRYCEERIGSVHWMNYLLNLEQFVGKYLSTIGIDYGVKQLTINGRAIKVNFWDMSGNPDFLEIRNEFYKDTDAVLSSLLQ